MLIEIDAAWLNSGEIPEQWRDHLERTPGGVKASGDDTGLGELYMHHGDERITFATHLGELLDWMKGHAVPVGIDPYGISSMLHHAHVPMPGTVFEKVSFLAMGDTANLVADTGEIAVTYANDYPYLNHLSRQDQKPDPETMLRLVTAATARQVSAGGNSGLLMLSSGKDSVSVALALAEADLRHIPCATYRATPDDPEPEVAAAICKRLGLDHQVIDMPAPGKPLHDTLTEFFRASPLPAGHWTQIPYATTVAAAAPQTGVVIDGGGNDAYMGFLPSRSQAMKQRFRIRGRRLAALATALIEPDSPVNYLARSRAEATLPGRTLRLKDSRLLYSDAVDTRRWWYELSQRTHGLDLIDLGNVTISEYVGSSAAMQKTRLAAAMMNVGVSLPFLDAPTIEYFFNLPEASRFNRKTGENKVLLREMLLHYLDYDAAAVGKHYFNFDGAEFIRQNRSYVRDEIAACQLWSRTAPAIADGLLNRLDSKPLMHHSILVLFLVSAWYNHSKYLDGLR